jgi:hypothetical protein
MKVFYKGKGTLRDQRGVFYSGQIEVRGVYWVPELYREELKYTGKSEIGQLEDEQGLILHLAQPKLYTTSDIINE